MGLSISEQETTVSYCRDGDICTVYTSDSTVMTKLNKLVENPKAPYWKLGEIHKDRNGEVVGKTYKTLKRLISFRTNISIRELTEDQKEAAADRMKAWQDRKRQENRILVQQNDCFNCTEKLNLFIEGIIKWKSSILQLTI